MDETSISCEFGKETEVFGSSQTHQVGWLHHEPGSGSGTHVTDVTAVSASGRKTPPFFIVQGTKVMIRWFDSLPAESYDGHVLTENNWLPSNGVVKMSEKVSMTSDIIPSFIRHLDVYVRQFLPAIDRKK